ncbi:C-type lectin domain family 4 member G-like [Takifugu rubripes]|uniref:C-type lectin domain family 4 member G-like n=1 Tax=Takifugu rubripes TaxID=31033 RepID=A0A3B5KDR8_TAKRU|nr:C-type lectin domain family 4 member G-like [Takifugu rubripes]
MGGKQINKHHCNCLVGPFHRQFEKKMSHQQKIFKGSNSHGASTLQHRTFGQGGAASADPHYPLAIKCLSLLNLILLMAAVVIGIYCAKDNYPEVPGSAIAPLLAEVNYYRNNSHIIKTRLEAEKTAAKQRAGGISVRLELKQQKVLTDNILKQIGKLQMKKTDLQSNISVLVESCNKCQPGWMLLKSACYYFSSQNKSDTKRNWDESRGNCVNQGGDLLVIDSLEKQVTISDNYSKRSSSETWWEMGAWIGLTGNATSGKWIWVNNVTAETFFWRIGQPKTEGTQSGDCAAFHYYGDARKTWYNGNCQQHLLHWICEGKPK